MRTPVCDYCDWKQSLTDIRMMLSQDVHIIDQARLERLRVRIENTQHCTPMQRQEILSLETPEFGRE